MSYNIDEYVVGWLFMAYKMTKKIADLSQAVFLWYTTVTYIHTHTKDKGENATRCILSNKSIRLPYGNGLRSIYRTKCMYVNKTRGQWIRQVGMPLVY